MMNLDEEYYCNLGQVHQIHQRLVKKKKKN